jgi:hypothetical protein
MPNEHDYDEEVMGEALPAIMVPSLPVSRTSSYQSLN